MKFLHILLFFLLSCRSDVVHVFRVIDGDTFVTSTGEIVRLYDIDSPERVQFFGEECKRFTESLILNREVILQRIGKDKYGRTLANVRLKPKASTINLCLVLRGYAWTSGKYCHNPELIEGQQFAKQTKQGLWAFPNPIPPYIFRKKIQKTNKNVHT